MPLRIESPYRPDLPWLRGNVHGHTTESDGLRTPQELVDAYAALGYDFIAISDHDRITPLTGLDARGLVLLPANEITAAGPHVLHLGARAVVPPVADRQRVFDTVRAQGGLTIVNHPNRDRLYAHCPQADLERWDGYHGIEIYNGVTRRSEGSPLATMRWDRMLSLERRVWGFANDDTHRPEDDGVAWNVVQAEERTPEAILHAFAAGRFYASTGVQITSITMDAESVHLTTSNAQRIVVVSDFGRRRVSVDGASIAFPLPDAPDLRYFRFECYGPGESMAWTQPFFVHWD
jgi:hypothetical protein